MESFISIAKWYFALDRYNYARWGTVHCFDLMLLQRNCPDIYEQFRLGNFSFLKTCSEYLRIALDQVHEQNNKVIKGSGGSTHLLNRTDESCLIRWETVGSDSARIVCEFEDSIDEIGTKEGIRKHHEDAEVFQDRFQADVRKVYSGMSCNPFKLNKLTAINNPSFCFPDIVFDNICKLEETGKRQFDEFLENRLIKQKVPINAKITENKFTLLGNANLNKKEKPKDMKIKQTIITKLRTALSYREKESERLFESELFGIAQSISEPPTTLYHSRKSQLLQRFEKATTLPHLSQNTSSAMIIELSAIIHLKGASDADTFHDFAVIIYYYIMGLSKGFTRIDIVGDQYIGHSVKEQIRKDRELVHANCLKTILNFQRTRGKIVCVIVKIRKI